MLALIDSLKEFQMADAYAYLYAIGANLGAYSGIVYFVLAVLFIYVLMRVGKFAVKACLALAVLYCCSGILVEYLPYLENVVKIF